MNCPIVIGVTGLKGSGKNEVFHALNEGFSNVHHICMSDPIYAEVRAFLGATQDEMEKNKAFYRPLLQWWGIYRRTKQGTDYWVKRAAERYQRLAHRANVVVFTSVRMLNEVDMIKALGGRIWRVVRPGVECDGHVTETQQLQIQPDMSITNDSTLETLHNRVVNAFIDEFPTVWKSISRS